MNLLTILMYSTAASLLLPRECSRVFGSTVITDAQCVHSFDEPTVIDYQNTVVNVYSLRLDETSCARYLMRLDNATVKDVVFALHATVSNSRACPKQVFGIFDTQDIEIGRAHV